MRRLVKRHAMTYRTSLALVFCRSSGLLAFALSVNACAAPSRDALRHIVQDQCAVHWLQQHDAHPCERIYLPDARREREGYAVLHDIKGGAHFLLIPTRTITGMESTELVEAGAPNYFAAAWQARDLVAAVAGHSIGRGAIGLALNPRHARSQDQLHIHIECLRTEVAHALRAAAPRIRGTWSSVDVGASVYEAMRVMGEELGGADPFELLADHLPGAKSAMGDYTLVLAGMDFTEGPGFILLAGTATAGEHLLDSTCAIVATS
jgi:CDP-diacylglycerol pyrophosphatase